MASTAARSARRGSGVALAVLATAVAGCSGSSAPAGPSPAGTGGAASSTPSGSPPASAAPTGRPTSRPSTAPDAGHLVGFNLQSHQIDVFDAQFKVVRHIAVPHLPSPYAVLGPNDTMLLTSTAGDALVDLHTGQAVSFTLPSDDEIPQYTPDGAKVLTFADPVDLRVSVVDVTTGAVTDASKLMGDPQTKFSGSGVPFPDAITYFGFSASATKTLVVPYDGSAPYALDGGLVALADRTAVTVTPTGDQSHVELWDGDTMKGSLTIAGHVRSGVLTGPTTATVVADDGRVLAADFAQHKTTALAALGGRDLIATELSADRLLVGNPDEALPTRLVDAQGHVVASFPPVGGQAVWFGGTYRPLGGPCFITQVGSKPVVTDATVTLRDTETGQVRAQLSGSASLARTPDGCTAINTVSEHAEAALGGTLHKFPPFTGVTAVSPDLEYVIVNGRPRSGDPTGWAALDVASGTFTPVPPGSYTWVSGAP